MTFGATALSYHVFGLPIVGMERELRYHRVHCDVQGSSVSFNGPLLGNKTRA